MRWNGERDREKRDRWLCSSREPKCVAPECSHSLYFILHTDTHRHTHAQTHRRTDTQTHRHTWGVSSIRLVRSLFLPSICSRGFSWFISVSDTSRYEKIFDEQTHWPTRRPSPMKNWKVNSSVSTRNEVPFRPSSPECPAILWSKSVTKSYSSPLMVSIVIRPNFFLHSYPTGSYCILHPTVRSDEKEKEIRRTIVYFWFHFPSLLYPYLLLYWHGGREREASCCCCCCCSPVWDEVTCVNKYVRQRLYSVCERISRIVRLFGSLFLHTLSFFPFRKQSWSLALTLENFDPHLFVYHVQYLFWNFVSIFF